MKERVAHLIKEAVESLFGVKEARFKVEVPREKEWGDLSTNVAFILNKALKKSPQEIGNALAEKLLDSGVFSDVRIEKGFINMDIKREVWIEEFTSLIREGVDRKFRKNIGKGEKVQVEFVSANPTGPLHLGHGRGAIVGDVLCNVLEFFGYTITREYYVNDAGNQVYLLGKSIYARYMELMGKSYPFPEEGYRGEYIRDIAENIVKEKGNTLLSLSEEEAIDFCIEYGLSEMLKRIREDLEDLDVHFDVWFSERSLYEKGLVDKVIKILEEKDLIYEKDGALWFKSSLFGDDKDRVIRKSDGNYTYFASDIAYHYEKFSRGFKKVINLWGADHHGYERRLKAALKALDIPEDWLEVYFVQMVKLFREGKEIKMSKRSGEFVTLRELIEEIGKDAVRFMFLTKRSDTPLSIDVDVVKEKSSENPVFYVQYAHARMCGISREMKNRYGVDNLPEDFARYLNLLELEEEMELIKKAVMFGDELTEIVYKKEPHVITYFLQDMASLFHSYYNSHRIVGDDINISMARYTLIKGLRDVFAFALELMGVEAPESM